MTRRNLQTGLMAALLAAGLLGPAIARAQNDDEDPPLLLKVYRVADLVQTVPDYPYKPGLPTTNRPETQPVLQGGFGGGVGGGVGGGGGVNNGAGGGNGGGFFSVPEADGKAKAPVTVLHQFGGMGGGGGGLGGFDPNLMSGGSESTMKIAIGTLAVTLRSVIDPDSWEDLGGEGKCEILGQMLVVRNTAAVHEQIKALLDELRKEGGVRKTVHIEAFWVQTNNDKEANGFRRQLAEATADPSDQNIATFLANCEQQSRYHGEISCHTGQTVHFTTGQRKTVVQNIIPTVGLSAVAYQPQMAYPNIGMVFQVLPTLEPDGKTATLDLFSTVNAWKDEKPPAKFATEFEGAQHKDTGQKTPGGRAEGQVDRVTLTSEHLATTVRVPVGVPRIVGSVTTDDAGDGTGTTQLHLVVHIVEHAEAK